MKLSIEESTGSGHEKAVATPGRVLKHGQKLNYLSHAPSQTHPEAAMSDVCPLRSTTFDPGGLLHTFKLSICLPNAFLASLGIETVHGIDCDRRLP